MTFNLRNLETEKKNLQEQRDNLSAKNIGLREEFRALENRLQCARDELYTSSAKIKSLQCEKKAFDLMHRELEDTKSKLELYKNIETAVSGSLEEVSQKLHEIGDYSKAAKDLSLICMSLKKELKKKNEYESVLQKEVSHKSRKISELRQKLETQSRELKTLSSANQELRSEMKLMEEELDETKTKIQRLQEAIVSPSGDVKSSAISRLVFEHPPPLNLTIMNTPMSSGSLKKKSSPDFFAMSDDDEDNNEPPSKKKFLTQTLARGSPCKEVTDQWKAKPKTQFVRSSSGGLTGLLGTIASDQYRCQPKQPGKVEGLSFNGFGGHGKQDEFPQPLKRDFKLKNIPYTKKPKGVARPNVAKPASSSQTIAKFFSLDTP